MCIILPAACYYDKQKRRACDLPPRPTVIVAECEETPLISDDPMSPQDQQVYSCAFVLKNNINSYPGLVEN